jgi:hypothetical protein
MLEYLSSTLLKHLSLLLLDLESLSLKPPSSSLLNGLLLHNARALASMALLFWGQVCITLMWLQLTTAVDRVTLLNKGWDKVYQLKPVERKEWYSIDLIVKLSIFPT